MEKINQAGPESVHVDLVKKAARFGAFGWLAFIVTLVVLVLQNLILVLTPKQILAVENGVVIGQVQFDEPRIRALSEIEADIKKWVARCTTVNKVTVYEDLAVCLNHMSYDLAEIKLTLYEKMDYGPYIENVGCATTGISFNPEKNEFLRDTTGYFVQAKVFGEVVCNIPGGKPNSQAFGLDIVAKLVPKNENNPLGIQVNEYEDI